MEAAKGAMPSSSLEDRSRAVAIWLFSVALLVLAMVVVGGATRLTGSGLSITQWRPISGVVPPMTDQVWARDFTLYRATPQYLLLNRGMSLADFKFIFWWEWAHRLLARMVGAAFAIPMAVLLLARRFPKRLIGPCFGLLALGGLQGLVGWWMVKSGLEARVSVAPERLAVHLGLALVLFSALIWTGFEAWFGAAPIAARRTDRWTSWTAVLGVAILLQCLLGALVAGNHGGLVDADWPLMGGRMAPADYWRGSLWETIAHGQASTQFDHRIFAYLTFTASAGVAIGAAWSASASPAIRRLAAGLAIAVTLQAGIGVMTLAMGVPLALAIVHQSMAAAVLATATALAWRSRRR